MKLSTLLAIAFTFAAAANSRAQDITVKVSPACSPATVSKSSGYTTTKITCPVVKVNGQAASGDFIESIVTIGSSSTETWAFDLYTEDDEVGTIVASGPSGALTYPAYGSGAYSATQGFAELTSGSLPQPGVSQSTNIGFQIALSREVSPPTEELVTPFHSGDGLPVSASLPAHSGEVITLHSRQLMSKAALSVTIGGLPATVVSLDRTPNSTRKYDLHVRVPAGLYAGQADMQIIDAYLPEPAVKIWVDGQEQQ